MMLFVGLGNPGRQYQRNRHNIGFMAIDALAQTHKFSAFKARFQAEVCEGFIAGGRVVALKPQTYMNESGRSVAEAARFYKIALDDIFVFHDDLDLAPGKLRVKKGGGDGGHNGLRSIRAHLGADYWRVRIGIGHPGVKALVQAWVLGDFAKADHPWTDGLCQTLAQHADMLVTGREADLQNKIHLATRQFFTSDQKPE